MRRSDRSVVVMNGDLSRCQGNLESSNEPPQAVGCWLPDRPGNRVTHHETGHGHVGLCDFRNYIGGGNHAECCRILAEPGDMKYAALSILAPLLFISCANEPADNPLDDYEELEAATILDAPSPDPARIAPENREAVARGEYLVELLGCGSCHTDGALIGEPKPDKSLAGSRIGIAYANPLGHRYPGIVFPPNITPDDKTGIGLWTDQQIALAIRAGVGRHWGRRIMVMPWQGYAKLSNDDVYAIIGYLRNIEPVSHQVPAPVEPGVMTAESFVYFGVYQSR